MLLPLYPKIPIEISHASGSFLYDTEGKRYLDTFSGLGVNAVGHSHPRIVEAQRSQIEKFTHLSNFFSIPEAEGFSDDLTSLAFGNSGCAYTFFANSGGEAMESALKYVFKSTLGTKKKQFLSLQGGFHGRSVCASMISSFGNKENVLPELFPVTQLSGNDPSSWEDYFQGHGENIAAVIFEGVQGAAGVRPMSVELAKILQGAREKFGFNLIADEIQAGLFRTGKPFSFQHTCLTPDIITLGKAIGGGLPLAATLFHRDLPNSLKAGEHGSTFGPNPLAILSGSQTLSILKDLPEHIILAGKALREGLEKIPSLKNVRGLGLMVACDLVNPNPDLSARALEEGLLLNVLGGKAIRFLPPLNISMEEIELLLSALEKL